MYMQFVSKQLQSAFKFRWNRAKSIAGRGFQGICTGRDTPRKPAFALAHLIQQARNASENLFASLLSQRLHQILAPACELAALN